MPVVIGSQADVPGTGDPIVSPWYQDTARKLVHTFANAAARNAWTTRPTGALAVTIDDKQLWFWNGAAWTAVPGVLALTGGTLTGNLIIQKVDATLYFNDATPTLRGYIGMQGNELNIVSAPGGGIRVLTGSADRLRILAAGTVMVHKFDTNLQVPGVEFPTFGAAEITQSIAAINLRLFKNGASVGSGQGYAQFLNASTPIGSITMTAGLNGVAYNTTSDRRLKNVVGPIPDALDRIGQLQPRRVTWIGAEDTGESDALIADEAAAVVPYAVTGEPDAVAGPPGTIDVAAVDVDGNPTVETVPDPAAPPQGTPLYQQLDYSKLAPLTIAAVQELAGMVDALAARIDALEMAA